MCTSAAFIAPLCTTSFLPLPKSNSASSSKRPRPPICPPLLHALARHVPRACTTPPPRKPSLSIDNEPAERAAAPPSQPAQPAPPAQPASPSPPPAEEAAPPAPDPNQSIPISLGPLSFSVSPRALLYVVPLLWGSFAPSVRFLFAQHPQQPAALFNSERLVLSTLIYAPILLAELKAYRATPPEDRASGRFAFFAAGIELGIFVFLANIAQVIGLKQTSASRAAFLVQLQTVFVPILGTALGVDSITLQNGLSSLVAVAGVALLSSDKSSGAAATLTGDALEVLSAIFFTAYVVRLGKFCKDGVAGNPLVAVKIATQALFSIGWAALVEFNELFAHGPTPVETPGAPESTWTFSVIAINVAVVLWTGLISSAASGWAQTKGQQAASPSEAVLIFATQPLWATALACALLGESFGPRGIGGGVLIVGATLLPTIASKIWPSDLDEEQGGKDESQKQKRKSE